MSWDGPNYNRQDSQGARGTITFITDGLVGVFFDLHSLRDPERQLGSYTPEAYLAGIPPDLLAIAYEHTMQYVLDDYQGRTIPVITAAFWSAGDDLTAVEPWPDVLAHGAHLIATEAMDVEDAIVEYQQSYEFSSQQVALLRSLFEHRTVSDGCPILLTPQERDMLLANGNDGIDESYALLRAIGIFAS